MVQGYGFQLFGAQVIGVFKTTRSASQSRYLIASVQKSLTRANGDRCTQIANIGFNTCRSGYKCRKPELMGSCRSVGDVDEYIRQIIEIIIQIGGLMVVLMVNCAFSAERQHKIIVNTSNKPNLLLFAIFCLLKK